MQVSSLLAVDSAVDSEVDLAVPEIPPFRVRPEAGTWGAGGICPVTPPRNAVTKRIELCHFQVDSPVGGRWEVRRCGGVQGRKEEGGSTLDLCQQVL